jgi:putative SOS response-associated peptidase YedK
MCGRYKLELPFSEIVRLYNLTVTRPSRFDNMPARYNIAPTQDVAAVRLDGEKQREFVMLRWGLIPYWSKDAKGGLTSYPGNDFTATRAPPQRLPCRRP